MTRNKIVVSCICIAEGHVNSLKKSIDCFIAQTYKYSELIIFHQDYIDINLVKDYAHYINPSGIRFCHVQSADVLTLSDIAGSYVYLCRGEFLCIWNSSDWHHKKRVESQFTVLNNSYKQACLLANVLIFNKLQQETFYSNARMWESTLFCRRDVFNQEINDGKTADGNSGFLKRFLRMEMIYPLVQPTLYIYNFNSENHLDKDHFQKVIEISQKLTPQFNDVVVEIINGRVSNISGSRMLNSKKMLMEINYWHWSGNIKKITELQKSN
jgi:hypothetical protein